ncbi:hypothetical protein [Acidisphaera sp. S103]|uniref:hypothetical protein n=1 Tax=Acidisphaera sp. S103 TaxID=1747223 RepID=UPI001C203470|nr:hypothetical protein [Acidisphaera sp. S103]
MQLIRPVRTIAHRFGGRHAQRDVIDLTLIEAAFRAGERDLAKTLAAERMAAKPTSPLAGLFARRTASWPKRFILRWGVGDPSKSMNVECANRSRSYLTCKIVAGFRDVRCLDRATIRLCS